jgi:hypothetical protein
MKYISKLYNLVFKLLCWSTVVFRLPATVITIYILCFILQLLQQFIILYEPCLYTCSLKVCVTSLLVRYACRFRLFHCD